MAKVKVVKSRSNLQGQGHKVKNFVIHGKVLSQGMYICNTKALPLLVKKLWPRLKFLKLGQTSRSRSQGQNYVIHGKVLSQGMYICNTKALPLLVKKLWPRLKIFKSRSHVKVKVTRSKILVPMERSCHKE